MFEREFKIKSGDSEEEQTVTLFDYQNFMKNLVWDTKPFNAIRKALLVNNNFDSLIDLETIIEVIYERDISHCMIKC
jgi:hypothetical protein